jgi:hypothetical protein
MFCAGLFSIADLLGSHDDDVLTDHSRIVCGIGGANGDKRHHGKSLVSFCTLPYNAVHRQQWYDTAEVGAFQVHAATHERQPEQQLRNDLEF